uniref:Uncharacterized protein n=1 Tax=Rhizophora mucronata TaxID=61149 RepID=A0A2P2N3G2_RHIMU
MVRNIHPNNKNGNCFFSPMSLSQILLSVAIFFPPIF